MPKLTGEPFKRPKSPFWYVEVEIRGRRVVRSSGTVSLKEARAFRRKLKAELEAAAGKPQKQEMTLDQACARYWIEKGQHLGWASHVARHLRWIVSYGGGSQPLSGLGGADVGKVAAARWAEQAGAAGVNRTLAVMRQVMGRAAKHWGVEVQPIDWRQHWRKEPKCRVRWLTHEEARRLCEALPEHIRLAVEWSLYTGCRKSETFGLSWDRVDLIRGQATIHGKTGTRALLLSAEARAVLAQCPMPRPLVFDSTNARKLFDAGLHAAGIIDFHWHDLRHTHATWMRQGGASLELVARSLGHSTIAVTQRYAHVDDQEVRSALAALPDLRPKSDAPNVIKMRKPST